MTVLARLAWLEHRPYRHVRSGNLVSDGEKHALTIPTKAIWKKTSGVQEHSAIRQLDQLGTFYAPFIVGILSRIVMRDISVIEDLADPLPRTEPRIGLAASEIDVG